MGTLSLTTSILIETLHQIDPGKPCTIFADNPQQVLFKLENCDVDRLANMRIIQVPLELKTVNEGIDKTITALADIAQALLPEWNNLIDEQEKSINRRWRSIAAALCEQGKVPLPKRVRRGATSQPTQPMFKPRAYGHLTFSARK